MASGRFLTKEMNNVVTAAEMYEAVLSHPLAEPLEQLLARERSAANDPEQKQHIAEHRRVLEHRLAELETRQLERQARRGR